MLGPAQRLCLGSHLGHLDPVYLPCLHLYCWHPHDTNLSSLQILTQNPHALRSRVCDPILQTGRLRRDQVGEFAKLHHLVKWQSQDLNPGILSLDPKLAVTKLSQPWPTGKLSILPREPCSDVARQGGLRFCVCDCLAPTLCTDTVRVGDLSVIPEPPGPGIRTLPRPAEEPRGRGCVGPGPLSALFTLLPPGMGERQGGAAGVGGRGVSCCSVCSQAAGPCEVWGSQHPPWGLPWFPSPGTGLTGLFPSPCAFPLGPHRAI